MFFDAKGRASCPACDIRLRELAVKHPKLLEYAPQQREAGPQFRVSFPRGTFGPITRAFLGNIDEPGAHRARCETCACTWTWICDTYGGRGALIVVDPHPTERPKPPPDPRYQTLTHAADRRQPPPDEERAKQPELDRPQRSGDLPFTGFTQADRAREAARRARRDTVPFSAISQPAPGRAVVASKTKTPSTPPQQPPPTSYTLAEKLLRDVYPTRFDLPPRTISRWHTEYDYEGPSGPSLRGLVQSMSPGPVYVVWTVYGTAPPPPPRELVTSTAHPRVRELEAWADETLTVETASVTFIVVRLPYELDRLERLGDIVLATGAAVYLHRLGIRPTPFGTFTSRYL